VSPQIFRTSRGHLQILHAMPQERHEESSMKTHNSGVICTPHYYLVLSDWWNRSDNQFSM